MAQKKRKTTLFDVSFMRSPVLHPGPQCILTQALLIFSGGEVCTYVSSHASELRVQVCRLCLWVQNPHAAICHSQPQQRLVGHSNCSNLQFMRSSICICGFCFSFLFFSFLFFSFLFFSFLFFSFLFFSFLFFSFLFFLHMQLTRSSKSARPCKRAVCTDEMHLLHMHT